MGIRFGADNPCRPDFPSIFNRPPSVSCLHGEPSDNRKTSLLRSRKNEGGMDSRF